jgi:hypothetical protein
VITPAPHTKPPHPRRFDHARFGVALADLRGRGLRPIILAVPDDEFFDLCVFLGRRSHLQGALVKHAYRGDNCVLWGYDPRPNQARLVPFPLETHRGA